MLQSNSPRGKSTAKRATIMGYRMNLKKLDRTNRYFGKDGSNTKKHILQ
jgi:hypothetical protein